MKFTCEVNACGLQLFSIVTVAGEKLVNLFIEVSFEVTGILRRMRAKDLRYMCESPAKPASPNHIHLEPQKNISNLIRPENPSTKEQTATSY